MRLIIFVRMSISAQTGYKALKLAIECSIKTFSFVGIPRILIVITNLYYVFIY